MTAGAAGERKIVLMTTAGEVLMTTASPAVSPCLASTSRALPSPPRLTGRVRACVLLVSSPLYISLPPQCLPPCLPPSIPPFFALARSLATPPAPLTLASRFIFPFPLAITLADTRYTSSHHSRAHTLHVPLAPYRRFAPAISPLFGFHLTCCGLAHPPARPPSCPASLPRPSLLPYRTNAA